MSEPLVSEHAKEVARGERFKFGENWSRFLKVLNDERIFEAEKSLKQMLGVQDLEGKSFLDIGSGSGLFSLAARRLGARVHSFDYDPLSVASTRELKRRYFPEDSGWTVEEGSVLDRDYLESLGKFDIVYSWGVLMMPRDMWRALDYAGLPVADGGRLFIAIYNDQGAISKLWLRIKRLYLSGTPGRRFVWATFAPYFVFRLLIADLIKDRNPVARYVEYKRSRGMSMVHDWRDWLGGYPFEVAKPEEVFEFYRDRGFVLDKLITVGRKQGNNEFVFTKR